MNQRKGPHVRRVYSDPLTGHSMWGKSRFLGPNDRPVAYREVEMTGRHPDTCNCDGCLRSVEKAKRTGKVPRRGGHCRVLKTVYVDDLNPFDYVDYIAKLKLYAVRLAKALKALPPPMVETITKEIIKEHIPAWFKQQAAEWKKGCDAWRRHKASVAKKRAEEAEVRDRQVEDLGRQRVSFTGRDTTLYNREVEDLGRHKARRLRHMQRCTTTIYNRQVEDLGRTRAAFRRGGQP
jgi:hypothetical protein